MDILKKNVMSILCGVVIILALVALVWPLGGMYESAQQQADALKARHEKLQATLQKQRTLPIVDLVAAEPVPLTQFPGQKVIDAGALVTKQVKAQSTAMSKAAVAMNEHALLVPGPSALPTPSNRNAFDFRDTYRRTIREDLPVGVLRATLPPTPEDIQAAADELWRTKYEPTLVYRVETDEKTGQEQRVALNEAPKKAEFAQERAGLPDRIRKERAEQFQMYAETDAISASTAVAGEGRAPSAEEMWYAQNALWVQQDVCRSIARINAKAKNVTQSPVKHLIGLNVPADGTQYVRPGGAGAAAVAAVPGEGEEAAAAVEDPAAGLPKNFQVSQTGRVSNPLFDVVHFSIEMNVDAQQVPRIIQELSREKFYTGKTAGAEGEPSSFVTVNRVNLTAVDKAAALDQGYVYGDVPVVTVTFDCEALMLRSWTEKYMPALVKRKLGVGPAAAPAEDGGGGGEEVDPGLSAEEPVVSR